MVKAGMTYDEAEAIAVQALGYLAENPEHLGRFLAETGVGPAMLREAAADPAFLAGIIDFVMSDESLVLAFAETARIRPTLIAVARHTLEHRSR